MKRSRPLYFVLIILVIPIGLASRKYRGEIPQFVGDYAGDVLWALMVFLMFGFFFPKHSILRVAIYALFFSYLIEISELYQAPWINAIRHTRLGGLILGFTFIWSDFICYTAGVLIGIAGEYAYLGISDNARKGKATT